MDTTIPFEPPHYVPKIMLFLNILYAIALSVYAYINFKYKMDQHLIVQVKDISKVPIFLLYGFLQYRNKNRWNGGGWLMTIIAIVGFSFGAYFINKILDSLLTAELQKKYFGEKDK
tara:strand:- start:171 stop:518 length:348 start_codon:yes stop_codon:yes gene_type:complete